MNNLLVLIAIFIATIAFAVFLISMKRKIRIVKRGDLYAIQRGFLGDIEYKDLYRDFWWTYYTDQYCWGSKEEVKRAYDMIIVGDTEEHTISRDELDEC